MSRDPVYIACTCAYTCTCTEYIACTCTCTKYVACTCTVYIACYRMESVHSIVVES